MSRKYTTCPNRGAQPHSSQRNCTIPAADGVQAFEVHGGNQRMVSLGHDCASTWLDNPESPLFHLEMLRLRQTTPLLHWNDIETGFYCRVDQRLRSELGGEHRSLQRRECMIAMGDQFTLELIQLLMRVDNLVGCGAIAPNSSEGAAALRELQAKAASVAVLGKAQL